MLRWLVIVSLLVAVGMCEETETEKPKPKSKAQEANEPKLLVLPEADACVNRAKHWKQGDHWYFLSSNVTEYEDLLINWLDARNLCRKHCMDSVSIETEEENEFIKKIMEDESLPFVWTSGRECDFKGCEDRQDLKPLNINGWFWPGSGAKIAATDQIAKGWTTQPWSQTGHFEKPQPDNAEFQINETSEPCLSVMNNVYKDGITWHDVACYHKKAVICEDSPPLLNYIRATNPKIELV